MIIIMMTKWLHVFINTHSLFRFFSSQKKRRNWITSLYQFFHLWTKKKKGKPSCFLHCDKLCGVWNIYALLQTKRKKREKKREIGCVFDDGEIKRVNHFYIFGIDIKIWGGVAKKSKIKKMKWNKKSNNYLCVFVF